MKVFDQYRLRFIREVSWCERCSNEKKTETAKSTLQHEPDHSGSVSTTKIASLMRRRRKT